MATPAANTETTPVLIVGAGPTGLTTAILLAKYGIQSTVIDRYETYLTQPKAHAINPRSLEILRQTGLDTEKLRAAGSTPGDAADVRFALSMAGLQLGSLPYERQGEDTKALTPEPLFNIPQYHLQQFLLDAAAALPEITMRKPFEWQSIRKADDNTLRSRVINRTTKAEIAISSDYVLFCDGANSQSRESIGIPFSPLPGQAQTPIHHISVHFDADLSSFDPGVLWFIVSPASTGAFISYERRSSWVFVFNYNPEETSADRFDEHYCRNLVDQVKIHQTVLPATGLCLPTSTNFSTRARPSAKSSHTTCFPSLSGALSLESLNSTSPRSTPTHSSSATLPMHSHQQAGWA
jgi:2-polyprenyl-6-methoxyphenol hydroxylase-like FAD-dependent oxidoreductase